jgi:hypothetical protein
MIAALRHRHADSRAPVMRPDVDGRDKPGQDALRGASTGCDIRAER